MKGLFRFALATSILSIMLPAAAYAQLADSMTFTTSFPFTVGHTNFAAGTYTARPLEGEPSVICIQGAHGGRAAVVIGVPDVPRREPRTSEVSFARENGKMVLKSLWDYSASEGLDVVPTVAPSHVNAN
jgi:hypothetical protein